MTPRQIQIVAAVVMVVMIAGTLLTAILKSSAEKSKVEKCKKALKECKPYAIQEAEKPTADCCKLANTTDSLCNFTAHVRQDCPDNFTVISVHQTRLLHLPSACNLKINTSRINATNCPALAHLNATDISTNASVGAGYKPQLVFPVQVLLLVALRSMLCRCPN